MYPEVWARVVRRTPAARRGSIRGYVRRRIRGEVYPALLPADAESTVAGLVYLDLSAEELAALDRFEGEGEAYRRTEVTVALDDGGLIQAATYLFLDPARVEETAWDPVRFELEDLAAFLDGYCRARRPGRHP